MQTPLKQYACELYDFESIHEPTVQSAQVGSKSEAGCFQSPCGFLEHCLLTQAGHPASNSSEKCQNLNAYESSTSL